MEITKKEEDSKESEDDTKSSVDAEAIEAKEKKDKVNCTNHHIVIPFRIADKKIERTFELFHSNINNTNEINFFKK